jgi:hypothetical protein
MNPKESYTREEIEQMLWLPCCHTSGMHDPVHFQERKYVCEHQKADALERFCKALGINPATKSRVLIADGVRIIRKRKMEKV